MSRSKSIIIRHTVIYPQNPQAGIKNVQIKVHLMTYCDLCHDIPSRLLQITLQHTLFLYIKVLLVSKIIDHSKTIQIKVQLTNLEVRKVRRSQYNLPVKGRSQYNFENRSNSNWKNRSKYVFPIFTTSQVKNCVTTSPPHDSFGCDFF